jgi:hypothetical protein
MQSIHRRDNQLPYRNRPEHPRTNYSANFTSEISTWKRPS